MERISGKGWNQSIFHWTWKKIRIFFVPRQSLWFPYLFHPVCDGKIKCYNSLEEKVLNQISDMVSPFISAFLSNSHLKWHLGNKMLCANIFLHSHNYLWNCSLVLGVSVLLCRATHFLQRTVVILEVLFYFIFYNWKLADAFKVRIFIQRKKGFSQKFSFLSGNCFVGLFCGFPLS